MKLAVITPAKKHPLAGQTVELVRRDPFKRFVIVRVLKTVGDYKKGETFTFPPAVVDREFEGEG